MAFEVQVRRSLKIYGSDIDRDSPFFKRKQNGERRCRKTGSFDKNIEGIQDKGPDYFFYEDLGKSISKASG